MYFPSFYLSVLYSEYFLLTYVLVYCFFFSDIFKQQLYPSISIILLSISWIYIFNLCAYIFFLVFCWIFHTFISLNVFSIFILKSVSGNLIIGVPVDLFILSDFFPAFFCSCHIVFFFVCLFLIVCYILHSKILCINNLRLG